MENAIQSTSSEGDALSQSNVGSFNNESNLKNASDDVTRKKSFPFGKLLLIIASCGGMLVIFIISILGILYYIGSRVSVNENRTNTIHTQTSVQRNLHVDEKDLDKDINDWHIFSQADYDDAVSNAETKCTTSFYSKQHTMFKFCLRMPENWKNYGEGRYENRIIFRSDKSFDLNGVPYYPNILILRDKLGALTFKDYVMRDINANVNGNENITSENIGFFMSPLGKAYFIDSTIVADRGILKGITFYVQHVYYVHKDTNTVWLLTFTVPNSERDYYRSQGIAMMKSFMFQNVINDYRVDQIDWKKTN